VKPSEISSHSSAVAYEMFSKTFSDFIVCVEGDATVTKTLLAQKWDYIFFTGSIEVGRHIMRAAAENCTNLTLELGGKSPVIIDLDADLELAAKRVVFGKFVNCGQTCIAPDHLYVPKSIKSNFIDVMKKYIREFYDDAQNNPDYPRIINNRHFDRLNTILEAHKENVILGGETDKKDLYIAPTLLDNVKQDSPVMNEEIFGPILPILEYERVSELIPILRKVKPLVLYVFSDRDGAVEFFTSQTSSGCVTVNDCLTQYHVKKLPFGGVGESGFGKYHGKHSFDTFSHQKSFYQRPTIPFLDQKMRYPPHTKESLELAERLDINISYGWVALIMFPIAIYALSRYVKSPK
jgi:aldehyde dehydrogenase (NAD+)